ncbi:MAG: hypothetical protein GY874_21775 [Desulfobacteraceae bacterium]|nr:hypothetical protein [Desulfobacteraceae bacterium]
MSYQTVVAPRTAPQTTLISCAMHGGKVYGGLMMNPGSTVMAAGRQNNLAIYE